MLKVAGRFISALLAMLLSMFVMSCSGYKWTPEPIIPIWEAECRAAGWEHLEGGIPKCVAIKAREAANVDHTYVDSEGRVWRNVPVKRGSL